MLTASSTLTLLFTTLWKVTPFVWLSCNIHWVHWDLHTYFQGWGWELETANLFFKECCCKMCTQAVCYPGAESFVTALASTWDLKCIFHPWNYGNGSSPWFWVFRLEVGIKSLKASHAQHELWKTNSSTASLWAWRITASNHGRWDKPYPHLQAPNWLVKIYWAETMAEFEKTMEKTQNLSRMR